MDQPIEQRRQILLNLVGEGKRSVYVSSLSPNHSQEESVADNALTTSSTNRYDLRYSDKNI